MDRKHQKTVFSPDTTFWRVNRELLLYLAGPRAVLMQLAHPLVAAGVADHSQFRRHPLRRLYRTARAATSITFGTEAAATRAITQIGLRHTPVQGTLATSVGPFPAGATYDASDPTLQLWVLSTITDSSLLVYQTFVRPLSGGEKEEYYRESLIGAQLFGLSGKLVPPTYSDFTSYMGTMLNSGAITVSDQAREVAKALFAPTFIGRSAYALSLTSIGLLPDRLRDEYGFKWTAFHARALHRLASLSRRVRPWLPSVLCVSPAALIGGRR